jgi:anti-sigma regulatory factor (Ser/Thr protein kinase)
MNTSERAALEQSEEPFRHEAFLYAGERQFLEGTTAFIHDAVQAEEPVLVVVSSRKIDLLREQLESEASKVRFADMDDVGLNPARIIPAWTSFVLEYGDRPIRGIGEPIWAERSSEELVECQRHESLLNVAFAGTTDFKLLCPYDTAALGHDVIDEARRSHPFIGQDGEHTASAHYLGLDSLAAPFSEPLPEPSGISFDFVFQAESLRGLRALVLSEATAAGMGNSRAADIVTAVNEVASNSLRHAGGWGVLRVWQMEDAFVCEVSDDGHIDEPLIGRMRPQVGDSAGRGLWMVNQLCELVQLRATSTGTTVRMHFRHHPRD